MNPTTRLSPTTKQRRPRLAIALAVLASAFMVGVSANPVAAHEDDEGIFVVIEEQRAIITTGVNFTDLGYVDTSGDGLLDEDERTAQQAVVGASLVTTVRDNIELTVDGEATTIEVAAVPALVTEHSDQHASEFVVLVAASELHDGTFEDLAMTWSFDSQSDQVVVSNGDDIISGNLGEDGTASFSLSTWASVRSFFEFGVEHIQYGPDHLLFLLVLTLAAVGTTVTGSSARRVLGLATAFTIGHAISLSLAFYDLITLPASLVEPAISLSIVATAALAIRGQFSDAGPADAGPWLTGVVGVVHGLGFASNLSTLGVTASEKVAALAAFNLGIDVAQMVVVLSLVAALWAAGRVLNERTTWLYVAGTAGAAAMGLVWTTSRIVGQLPVG